MLAKFLPAAVCAAVLVVAVPHLAVAQVATLQELQGPTPSTGSTVAGISSNGKVIVGVTGAGNNPGCSSGAEAATWTINGTLTLLGFPGGGNCSYAASVNSDGTVIGGIGINNSAGNNAPAPTIWTNGTATELPQNINCCGNPPPVCGAGIRAINANATSAAHSVVVGQDASGQPGCGPGIDIEWVNGTETAFLGWSPMDGGVALGVSANGSVIVGNYGNNAFRWTSSNGTTPILLGDFGGGSGQSNATNTDGSVVVGTAADDNIHSQPFRWTQSGGLQALCPAAVFATALAVSGDGSVVVGSAGNGGPAFRWTASTGCQQISTLLNAAGINITGWSFSQAVAISADGTTIAGNGAVGTQGTGWVMTLPVPGKNSATHDFNKDSRSDILWRDTSGDTTVWLMGSNGGVQQGESLGNIPTAWSVAGVRDFNGDGTADILWRNTEGDTTIWFMNNGSVASGTNIGNIPTAWSVVGTGDFNGDGKGDILWHDTGGDTTIWFMNGGTIAGSTGLGTVPTIWSVAGVGDFNGDGYSDILWRDIYGDVTVWLMNAGSIKQGVGLGNVATNWSVVGTGDFNADSYTDILWRDTAGDIMIWLMNGGTLMQQSVLGNVPTTWTVAETGDFNGDGKSDIVWLDTSGNVMMWFMNGLNIAGIVNLGNVGTAWSIQGANAD